MIEKNILEDIERCDIADFRYLMYLARNNAWVKVGNDLFRVDIKGVMQRQVRHEADGTHYHGYNETPIDDQNKYKLILAKCAADIMINASDKNDAKTKRSLKTSFFSRQTIELHKIRFDHQVMSIRDNKENWLQIHIVIENYDMDFVNRLEGEADSARRVDMVKAYRDDRKAAFTWAEKNAVWSAAMSGDEAQLKILFDKLPAFDIHATHDGKTIVEAMLSADPEINLPFQGKNLKIGLVLDILKKRGFDFERQIAEGGTTATRELCQEIKKRESIEFSDSLPSMSSANSDNAVHRMIVRWMDNNVNDIKQAISKRRKLN